MDEFTTGIESQENEAATSSSQQSTGFAEALAAATSEGVSEDQDTYLELTESGRSNFTPNLDETRDVVICGSNGNGDGIVSFKRTGQSESQGMYAPRIQFESSFDIDFDKLDHKTQLNLVMANGKVLIGYVVKGKSRNGAYFQKKYAEPVLTMPPHGKQLPIKILTVIVG